MPVAMGFLLKIAAAGVLSETEIQNILSSL
jgi:hypothetical protein